MLRDPHNCRLIDRQASLDWPAPVAARGGDGLYLPAAEIGHGHEHAGKVVQPIENFGITVGSGERVDRSPL